MRAMIFVNFKTYREGTGEKAVELARICEKVQSANRRTKLKIIPVVQAVDLYRVKDQLPKLEIWAQHLDSFPQGQYTGWINLEAIKEAGASGAILNHSEHRIPPGKIRQVIKRIKDFKILVCCKSSGQAERLVKFKPDLLAYELPELIGDRKRSVASEEPETIKNLAKMINLPLIVGAGIHSRKDVEISLKMGAQGVLVATDVVLAKDPRKELEDLAKGFE